VDPRTHHDSTLSDSAQGERDESADGREDDGRVELVRKCLIRVTGPDSAEVPREILARRVAGSRDGEDPPSLIARDLGDDVRGCAETVEAKADAIAGCLERAVPDEAGAASASVYERSIGKQKRTSATAYSA
jgi:hypothetical protein